MTRIEYCDKSNTYIATGTHKGIPFIAEAETKEEADDSAKVLREIRDTGVRQ